MPAADAVPGISKARGAGHRKETVLPQAEAIPRRSGARLDVFPKSSRLTRLAPGATPNAGRPGRRPGQRSRARGLAPCSCARRYTLEDNFSIKGETACSLLDRPRLNARHNCLDAP